MPSLTVHHLKTVAKKKKKIYTEKDIHGKSLCVYILILFFLSKKKDMVKFEVSVDHTKECQKRQASKEFYLKVYINRREWGSEGLKGLNTMKHWHIYQNIKLNYVSLIKNPGSEITSHSENSIKNIKNLMSEFDLMKP